MPEGPRPGFEYKLELLKDEIYQINVIIARIDSICQTTKYWTILIFVGVLTAILGSDNTNLLGLLLVVPIIPVLFWLLESSWRRHQSKAIYRLNRISKFMNSSDFDNAVNEGSFGFFIVLDTMGTQYEQEIEYQKFISFWKLFKYKITSRYYFGLILISLFIALFLLLDL